MKFKVGDKVRVRKDLITGERYYMEDKKEHDTFVDDMEYLKGQVVTIKSVDKVYRIEEEEYNWTDEMFEPHKVFTKADLENGMVVEYRNGKRRMVLNNYFVSEQYSNISNFNDLLENKYDDDLSIKKVYKTRASLIDKIFNDYFLELIWERPEDPAKKMTVEEIEKELGYKIEIVSEVNKEAK